MIRSDLKLSIGIDCSCMPHCAIWVRRYLPLLVKLKAPVALFPRALSAQVTQNSGWEYFRSSSAGSSNSRPKSGPAPDSVNGVVVNDLPEISKGMH